MPDQEQLLNTLKEEVGLAVGCTEPASVAYAAAVAAEQCKGQIQAIDVLLSPGVFKNAYAVNILGTGEKGIPLAAALGAVTKNSGENLQLLKNLAPEDIFQGKELVKKGLVNINYECDLDGVYLQINLRTEKDNCKVIVNGGHTSLELVELNGDKIYESSTRIKSKKNKYHFQNMPLQNIIDLVATQQFTEIEFLVEHLQYNKLIAARGISKKTGLGIGYGLKKLITDNYIEDDLINNTKALVAAGSDVRMAGVDMTVNTSFGSGNQGILATIAVNMVAEHVNSSDEQLARALAMSHLVNGYVKDRLGKLSPLCGCAVSAGLGVAATTAWLLGGSWTVINGAMNNLLGNICGILCDGAKGSCAFKLATSAGEALTAAFLAKENIFISDYEGIVEKDIEKTIQNISAISSHGMKNLDQTIIALVLKREKVKIS